MLYVFIDSSNRAEKNTQKKEEEEEEKSGFWWAEEGKKRSFALLADFRSQAEIFFFYFSHETREKS